MRGEFFIGGSKFFTLHSSFFTFFSNFAIKDGELLGNPKRASSNSPVSEEKTNEFVLFFSQLFVTLHHIIDF